MISSHILQLTLPLMLSLIMVGFSHARPISYADSWTLMQKHTSDHSRVHVHYSPSAFDSIGIVAHYFSSDYPDFDLQDTYAVSAQWNHLLARKNTRHSQANFYSKIGLGYHPDVEQHLIAQWDLAGDWETRRYFTSADLATQFYNEQFFFSPSGRVGIAPYVAEYNSLHTWLMLEVAHNGLNDVTQLMPIVRLFKGDILGEIGYTGLSTDDSAHWQMNLIIRF